MHTSMKRFLLLVAVIFSVASVTNLAAQEVGDTTDILLVGQSMPEFSVTTMDGDPFHSKQLAGKVVLINFFATWCPPCRKELPAVQSDIYDRFHERDDFKLMIISREESPEKVIPFVTDKAYPMEFFSDMDRSCYALFAHQFIPRNYLFDATGKLVYASRGYTEDEFAVLVAQLEELLR